MEEARNAISTLVPTVEEIRQSSNDVSQRLAALESEFASRTPRQGSMLQNNDSLSQLDDLAAAEEEQSNRITPVPGLDSLTAGSQLEAGAVQVIDQGKTPKAKSGLRPLRQDLELALQSSRPYARLRPMQPNPSASSFSHFFEGHSYLSGFNLSDISNLSVLSLPISIHEIWNSQHYSTSMEVQRTAQDRRNHSSTVIDRVDIAHLRPAHNEEYLGEECEATTLPLSDEESFPAYDSTETSSIDNYEAPLDNDFPKQHVKLLLLGVSRPSQLSMCL